MPPVQAPLEIYTSLFRACANRLATFRTWLFSTRLIRFFAACRNIRYSPIGAASYLAPFLGEVTGISGELISVFLLAYGVANAVGTFAGGWAADRGATTTLVVANVVLILALGVLYLVGSAPILVALTLVLWGLVGFGLVPSLQ